MREGLEGEGGKLAEFLGELILCGGFFLVYFVEEIVHLLLYKKNEEHLHRFLFISIYIKTCKVWSKLIILNYVPSLLFILTMGKGYFY